MVITDAGRAAISVDPVEAGDSPAAVTSSAALMTPPPAPEVPALEVRAPAGTAPARTKTAEVLDLLRRESDATLDELTTATGWLPHTTRVALTGLRKKGHAIIRCKRGDMSCYTLEFGAAA